MLPVHRSASPTLRTPPDSPPHEPTARDRLIPTSAESLEAGPRLLPRTGPAGSPSSESPGEASHTRSPRLMRLPHTPRHSAAATPSRSPQHTSSASPFRSPLHPQAAAASPSASALAPPLQQDIDQWLKRGLQAAEPQPAEAETSHSPARPSAGAPARSATADAPTGKEARKALRQAAEEIRNAAAHGSTQLSLNFHLPAETLPETLGHLQSLHQLILRSTALRSLPDSLGALLQLGHLAIGPSPELHALPRTLVTLPALEQLELNGVALKAWPEDIGMLERLHTLTQTGGTYRSLPDSFVELKNLRHLDLRDLGKFRELPENIGQMQSLRSLSVQATRLSELPASLADMPLLRELRLDNNKRLQRLPITLGHMQGLTSLSLNGCSSLKTLPVGIGDLKLLRKLDLRGTGIDHLPRSLARLSPHCEILVPSHLKQALAQLRNPAAAAGDAGPSRGTPGSGESTRVRIEQLRTDLEAADPELAAHFGKWASGFMIQARYGAQPPGPGVVDMIEAVVAEAVRSAAYRSAFGDFLELHAPKVRDPLQGVTVAVQGQEIRGDAGTAYAHLLEYRLTHTTDHEEALSLLTEAIENPDMHMTELKLLNGWDSANRAYQMWPPLRAYITLHDRKGAAAMDKRQESAMADHRKAEKGKMKENELNERALKAKKLAESAIEARARELASQWKFPAEAPPAPRRAVGIRIG